jgi:hypothetical protein
MMMIVMMMIVMMMIMMMVIVMMMIDDITHQDAFVSQIAQLFHYNLSGREL